MPDAATKTDRLKAAHEKLTHAVQSIVTGEDWQRMLQGPPSVGPRTSAATSGGELGLRPKRQGLSS